MDFFGFSSLNDINPERYLAEEAEEGSKDLVLQKP